MNLYVMLTGGGSKYISDMLTAGGASSYFIGASIPYSQVELQTSVNVDLSVVKSVSKETCDSMLHSCDMILSKAPYNGTNIGIACTASLKKDGQRKDRLNHAYAGYSLNGMHTIYHINFYDGRKTRLSQEEVLCMLLNDIQHEAEHNISIKQHIYDYRGAELCLI